MKRFLKNGLIFLLTTVLLIALQSFSASAKLVKDDSDLHYSARQLGYGYIPGKIHGANAVSNAYVNGDMETYYRLSGRTYDPMSEKDALPSSYDSRNYNYVTSVKNQNPYGSCWAHAAAACVESYMIKFGVPVGSGSAATTSLNLSETQHCFFNYSAAYDAEGMLTGDTCTLTGSDSCLDTGGNGEMSTYTLMRWTGAADEAAASALKYSNASSVARNGLNSQYAYSYDVSHVQNSEWIPGTDVEAIKEAIMKYGAGNISYYETGSAYTYICTVDKTSQESSSHKWANHAITVVGWDDNISAKNFKPNSPKNNGAWICKNSWGTTYFNQGYCYISYEDTSVLEGYIYFYDAEPVDNYDHNYQYDGTCNVVCYGKGWPSNQDYYVGFANNTKVANVFTAQGNELLKAVGYCNWDEALNYTVEIYKDPTAGNPSSGTLMSTQTGSLVFAGYYTIPLDTPVRLSEGDTFSVVITQNVPVADESGKYVHTPYDASFNNSSVLDWCTWTHKNHGNTSYYKEPNGSWTDCPDNGDYRIKAYTADVTDTHEHSYEDWTPNNDGTHSKVCSECGDKVTENCTYTSTVTPPTATEQGYTMHTCTVCGYSFTDSYTDPLGYTVSFSVPAGLTEPAAMNCRAGSSITLPTAQAPEGYTFLGWTENTYNNVSEAPAYFSGSYSPTGDITLKALYSHTDSSGTAYQLLTAAPDNWEGSYVISFGKTEDMYILKGITGTKKYESASAGGAAAFADSGMTLDGAALKDVNSVYVFKISSADGKLAIWNESTGSYLVSRGGYLYSYKNDSSSYGRWTAAMNGGSVDAVNGASSKLPHLAFSAGKHYFMVNKSADTGIYFWKLSGSTVTVYTTEIN